MNKRIICIALVLASFLTVDAMAQERASAFFLGGDMSLNLLSETSLTTIVEGTEGTLVRRIGKASDDNQGLGFNANALLGYQIDAAWAVELKGGLSAYSSVYETNYEESRSYYSSQGGTSVVTANDKLGFQAFTLSVEAFARYSLSTLFGVTEGHGFQALCGAGFIFTNANAGIRYDAIASWPSSSSGSVSPRYNSTVLVPMRGSFYLTTGLEYEVMVDDAGYYIGVDARVFPLGLIGKDSAIVTNGTQQRTVSAGLYDLLIPSLTLGARYYLGR